MCKAHLELEVTSGGSGKGYQGPPTTTAGTAASADITSILPVPVAGSIQPGEATQDQLQANPRGAGKLVLFTLYVCTYMCVQ